VAAHLRRVTFTSPAPFRWSRSISDRPATGLPRARRRRADRWSPASGRHCDTAMAGGSVPVARRRQERGVCDRPGPVDIKRMRDLVFFEGPK